MIRGTRLFDGENLVEIVMNNWVPGQGYTPDWSADFFGLNKYNEDMEALEVEEVNYCIDQANDWKNAVGDFEEDEPNAEEIENRNVDVTWLELPPMTKDGEYIKPGMWVSDQTGIYEVKDVTGDRIELSEIIFDEDSDTYHHGDRRILTKAEARKLEYC